MDGHKVQLYVEADGVSYYLPRSLIKNCLKSVQDHFSVPLFFHWLSYLQLYPLPITVTQVSDRRGPLF